LIEIAPIIHKDNEGKPNEYDLFFADQRFTSIKNDLDRTMEKCFDTKLDARLGAIIEITIRMVEYSMNPLNLKYDLDEAHRLARQYTNKLKGREKWKIVK
jgi:hypothetical protein